MKPIERKSTHYRTLACASALVVKDCAKVESEIIREHGVPLLLSETERAWKEGSTTLAPISMVPVSRDWIMKTMRRTVNISNNRCIAQLRSVEVGPLQERNSKFDLEDLETITVQPEQTALSGKIPDQILSILMKRHFRRGRLEDRAPFLDTLREQIDARVQSSASLEIMIPSMPCKSPNPLNNNHSSVEDVDLGEYLAMAQMRDLVASIAGVYAPGVKIYVLTDGCLYADLFADGNKTGTMSYQENLRRVRDEFSLRGKVEVIDITWLTKREPAFEYVKSLVRDIVKDLAETDEEFRDEIDVLTRGMFWNVGLPVSDINEIVDLANSIDEPQNAVLKDELRKKAIEYTTILLTLSHLNIFGRAFPNALRGTVHPKEEPQVPLNLVSSNSTVLPYVGVPVVSRRNLENGRTFRNSTRIVRYYELLQDCSNPRVVCRGSGDLIKQADIPFYYEID